MLTEGYQVFYKQHKENSVERYVLAVTELANDLQGEPDFQSVKKTGHLKAIFTMKLTIN